MKREEKREQIKSDFLNMIFNSWTYARLTKEEKSRLIEVYNNTQTREAQKGTKAEQWEILQAIYTSFLNALNYKPIGWREQEQDQPQF